MPAPCCGASGRSSCGATARPSAACCSTRQRSRPARRRAPTPLFQALRAERARLARAQGVPPYVVFHDSTLLEMAAARPASLQELRGCSGMGEKKLERYGAAFLAIIRAAAP